MSERLSPTEAHESLDRMGVLEESQQPGCYALELHAPNSMSYTYSWWDDEFDSRPNGGELEDITKAERVAYVGASGHVYDRIMTHARGDVRKSAYLQVFPPTGIVDVWPSGVPFQDEFNRAVFLAESGWVVVTDGEVVAGE